jgi:hypothetical protein
LRSGRQIQPQGVQLFPIRHPEAAYLATLHIDFPSTRYHNSSVQHGYEELYLVDSDGRIINAFSSGPIECSASASNADWQCTRLHGVGDFDRDGFTDFLTNSLSADGAFPGMGGIQLYLSSSQEPAMLTVWYGG